MSNFRKPFFFNLILTSVLLFTSSSIKEIICGKIGAHLPGVMLSDYRFGLGDPYVKFYERNNYRGKVHFQMLGKDCQNLPDSRQNWASSVDVLRRCITVCDQLDCEGNCVKIYADSGNPNNKGASRLSNFNMNDKVKSVKFCYPSVTFQTKVNFKPLVH